jgi:glycosyltransferase involved in cell wall biosynthesis
VTTGHRRGKLAIVTEAISPYRIPVFNDLAKRLGEDLLVLFLSSDGGREWTVPLSRLHFPYRVLNGIRLSRGLGGSFPRFWNPAIVNHLRDFAPTLTVIGGYHQPTSYAVWWYAKRWRSKLFLACESNGFYKRPGLAWAKGLKWAFIRTCDGYIVPGEASARYLSSFGIDEERIVVAPNSIDTEPFARLAETEGELLKNERRRFQQHWGLPDFNLLFVGRLAPEKSPEVALEVVKRLQRDRLDVGLILIGDGPLRRQLEAVVQRDRLRHTVFLGFKQPDEVPFYYGLGDLLIHPARSEPWGLVIHEAMMAGVPVLCSRNVGAAWDLVIEGQTGHLCDAPDDYVHRIRRLISDPSHLAAMKEHCRSMAASFSPEGCAEGFLRALEVATNG